MAKRSGPGAQGAKGVFFTPPGQPKDGLHGGISEAFLMGKSAKIEGKSPDDGVQPPETRGFSGM